MDTEYIGLYRSAIVNVCGKGRHIYIYPHIYQGTRMIEEISVGVGEGAGAVLPILA